jgi:hypothetical protein
VLVGGSGSRDGDGASAPLTDAETLSLFPGAKALLNRLDQLATIDSVHVPEQSRVARFIISVDRRGQPVRNEASYVGLARRHFGSVGVTILLDLMRMDRT